MTKFLEAGRRADSIETGNFISQELLYVTAKKIQCRKLETFRYSKLFYEETSIDPFVLL